MSQLIFQSLINILTNRQQYLTELILKTISPIRSQDEILKKWNDITFWKAQIIQLDAVKQELRDNEHKLSKILANAVNTESFDSGHPVP